MWGKLCSLRNIGHWLVSNVRSVAQVLCVCVSETERVFCITVLQESQGLFEEWKERGM